MVMFKSFTLSNFLMIPHGCSTRWNIVEIAVAEIVPQSSCYISILPTLSVIWAVISWPTHPSVMATNSIFQRKWIKYCFALIAVCVQEKSFNFNRSLITHVLKYLKCWEAVSQRCSVEKVFLEISQSSQENTCARVSFLIKLGLQLY